MLVFHQTSAEVDRFQCYDKYMLTKLQMAATKANHSDWGNGGPDNAGTRVLGFHPQMTGDWPLGTYNNNPCDTQFFCSGGYNNYESDYGQFFLGMMWLL